MSKRIMCVWLPNWPAQRATVAALQDSTATLWDSKSALQDRTATLQVDLAPAADRQKLHVGPIILYRQDARRGNVVAAANQLARQHGILPQMPLSQCGPLCPEAVIQNYEPQQDLEALIELAEQSQCYSPIVGLEPLADHPWAGRALLEPQCLILDVTGVTTHFGGEQPLAHNVAQWLMKQGYLSSIAIGDSIGQAWAMANYAYRRQTSSGMLIWEKNGCSAPAPASESEQHYAGQPSWFSFEFGTLETSLLLRSLPIEALRLDLLTAAKLHRLGIRYIDQLLALPRSSLPSRFGDNLLAHIDHLEPSSSEVIRSLHHGAGLCLSHSYEYPTPNREEVSQTLALQLQLLAKELKLHQTGAMRVTTRIALEKSAIDGGEETGDSQTPLASVLQVSFYQATDDPDHMLWLLQAQLESPACRVSDAYRAKEVATQVTLSAPIVWTQNDLFGGEGLKHRDSIAKLIDHLSVRMGRNSVVTPTVYADPAPENSYRWHPMTGLRKDGSEQETKRKLKRAPKRDYQEHFTGIGPTPNMAWRRPVRLLGKPMPLAITEMAANHLPAIVRYPKANTNVCDAQGPERIQTGWWAGAMLQRDYYRMQLQNGVWLWCFLDLKSREWFVHGVFD